MSFLDQKYPDHPLTPTNPDQARDALEWEQFLDREIGLTLRLWLYCARHRTRRYFQWVGETYQKHRQPAH